MGSVPSPVPEVRVPDLVPVLSRGKHRNPRQGACFMELASFVAGERWSDHPSCTHPLLAQLARLVNDHTSDDGRHHLAGMIPDVIGLKGADPRLDIRIALHAATASLPVASARRQAAMAAAVVAGNRLVVKLDGTSPAGGVEEESRWALVHAPDAARWAEDFADDCPPTVLGFRRFGAPMVVRTAVEGIAQACIPDPDQLLRDLLRRTIDDCKRLVNREDQPPPRRRERLRRVGVSRR